MELAYRWRPAVLLVVLGLFVVGLAGGITGAFAVEDNTSESPASGDAKVILRVGWTAEPDNLNPFMGWATASYEVWGLNYDQLVGADPVDLSPVPTGLATGWDISPDGRTYTFHLREGVKWQDGEPFSAEDVAWTYNYIIDNEMYAYGVATVGIRRAEVVDPSTVRIVCSEPKADMLRIWVPILPKHLWEKVSPQAAANSYVMKMPIVGTGPFQCVEFKKGEYVRMVANQEYFGGAPHLDEVIFQQYQNADTMTSDLKAGAIDAAQGIPQAQFDRIGSTSGMEAADYNYRNWDYLAMNCYEEQASHGHPALRDIRFRQALNWAIDRQKLADIAWAGRAAPGTTIMPPDNWIDPDYHWEPPIDRLYTFDPEKAGQILNESGYSDADGDGVREYRGKPIELRLWAPSDSAESQAEAKVIAGELKEIGLKVELEVLDAGVYNDRIWNYEGDTYAPDFDLYVWSWDGYSDPGQTLSSFTSDQIEGWNEPCWSNAEFDRLCEQQAVTMNQTERQQIVWRMQEIMYEESPEIAITYPRYLQAYDTAHWTGWTRVLGGKGPAFFLAQPDTYLNLQPVAGEASEGPSGWWLAIAVVAAVAIVIVVVVALMKRRHEEIEE